jgi:hypothetical protein
MVTALRCILLTVCLVSVVILANRYRVNRDNWSSKTRDYWYAQLMWCVAGVAIPLEGILRQTPFRYSFTLLLAASIVNLIGLRKKGPWGTNNKR